MTKDQKKTNRILYIIPGWNDSPCDEQYTCLSELARCKGYKVVGISVNWKRPLSKQVFEVPKDAAIFGFSLGAILAWLIAQKYPCEHLILGSMTLHKSFIDPDDKKALIDLAGKEFVQDIIDNLTPSNLSRKQTVIYGDKEGEKADVLVRDTEHELTDNYIMEVTRLL